MTKLKLYFFWFCKRAQLSVCHSYRLSKFFNKDLHCCWFLWGLILISKGQFLSVKWVFSLVLHYRLWFYNASSFNGTDWDIRVTVLLDTVIVFVWISKTGQFQSDGVSVGRPNKKQVAESWHGARHSGRRGLGHQRVGDVHGCAYACPRDWTLVSLRKCTSSMHASMCACRQFLRMTCFPGNVSI